MREQFELWFKATRACESLEEMNYFKMDLFHFVDGRNWYRHSSVQIAFMTWQEQQAKIDGLKESVEMALISLNHLKENTVTHRDHGNEHTAIRDFNDLLKLASDVEDCLLLGGLYDPK